MAGPGPDLLDLLAAAAGTERYLAALLTAAEVAARPGGPALDPCRTAVAGLVGARYALRGALARAAAGEPEGSVRELAAAVAASVAGWQAAAQAAVAALPGGATLPGAAAVARALALAQAEWERLWPHLAAYLQGSAGGGVESPLKGDDASRAPGDTEV